MNYSKIEKLKKINMAIESLDRMAKAIIDLSYKTKVKLSEGSIDSVPSDLLKNILILREIQEKNLNILHEQLSDSMNIKDLYSMIS